MVKTISPQQWSRPTSNEEAYRRAGGQRRYNSVRWLRAEIRRLKVARLLKLYGGLSRGVQAQIARELRVSRATVCRDVAQILRPPDDLGIDLFDL